MTSVDHPEIDDWPVNLDELGVFKPFRGQSRLSLLLCLLGGVVVSAGSFALWLWLSGNWVNGIVGLESTTEAVIARRNAATVSLFITQLYFIGLTVRAYGWPTFNHIFLPIVFIFIGSSFASLLFSSNPTALPELTRHGGSIHHVSSLIDTVILGTPLVILFLIELELVARWTVRNPEKAVEWEQKYLPYAIISNALEEEGINPEEIRSDEE